MGKSGLSWPEPVLPVTDSSSMNTMNNKISPQLLSAYKTTRYWVDAVPQRFCLRIGHYSEPLAQLLAERDCQHAAFISACNPGSELHADAVNARAHQQLKRVLADRSVSCIEGAGRDPAGKWPEEKSILVLGLSRKEACRIARDFRQNAILWMEADGVPDLVLL